MSNQVEYDTSVPFALFMISDLEPLADNAKTDAQKLDALRRCFTAYLLLNAGHYLFKGVNLLTNFILSDFAPFTDGRVPTEAISNWLDKYPLTDSISAECHAVPTNCFDLFITDEKDLTELCQQLEKQGLIESMDSEMEAKNDLA